jgi:hypothetical protein
MDDKKIMNPCIRCGKERIDVKSWTEEVTNYNGTSHVTHTETICPDPECQKQVEKQIQARMGKRQEREAEKEKRMAANEHLRGQAWRQKKTP